MVDKGKGKGKEGKGKAFKGGKGKGEAKGKGEHLPPAGGERRKGKGKGGRSPPEDSEEEPQDAEDGGAMLLASMKRGARGEEGEKRQGASKQHLEARGSHCEVKKHSDMGCAVVSMETPAAREVVLRLAAERTPAQGEGEREKRPQVSIGDFSMQLRPHYDKANQADVKTDIFVAWGRQNEKRSPLAAAAIAEAFDNLFREAQAAPPAPRQALPPQQQAFAAAGMAQAGCCPQQCWQQQAMMPTQGGMPQSAMAMQYMAQQYGFMPMQCPGQQQAMQAMMPARPPSGPAAQVAAQLQLQQQQRAAAAGEDAGNGMRADAPAFMFSPQQNASAGAGVGGYEYSDMSNYAPTPERKVMTIVDPKSGQPIKLDPPPNQPSEQQPRAGAFRPLSIIDPNSGSKVDTMGLNFARPKTAKLSIIDPSCGASIEG